MLPEMGALGKRHLIDPVNLEVVHSYGVFDPSSQLIL